MQQVDDIYEAIKRLEKKLDKLSEQLKSGVTKEGLDISESATYLGCSEWSVRELIYQKKLKKFNIGRKVLVPLQELKKLMQDGGVKKLS
jgi:excisionase family DNA binding protein